MRTANRNKRTIYYCLYRDKAELTDEWGNASGEFAPTYDNALSMSANVSPATGNSQTEQFGNLDDYDKVIVTSWMDCPIDENTVLFIDKNPEYATVTVVVPTQTTNDSEEETDNETDDSEEEQEEPEPVTMTISTPVYDYRVRRVAKSLNHISIAVSKVKVS